LGLLEKNAEFDDNVLDAFINKFMTPLLPCSIFMLVRDMEKVKPKGES
jgi:hypothetical protein